MLRSIKQLHKCSVRAADGDAGEVSDFYFDDRHWTIRYLVVETSAMSVRRQALVSPVSIADVDWTARMITLATTRRQIENSPDFNADKPVSRQHEEEFFSYYGYPFYWHGTGIWGAGTSPFALAAPAPPPGLLQESPRRREPPVPDEPRGDPHLRSTWEVIRYRVDAADGELGSVDDFLVDDESWQIRYAVVETGGWWSGKKVIVEPARITAVDWEGRAVSVGISRESLEGGPIYDPDAQAAAERRADRPG